MDVYGSVRVAETVQTRYRVSGKGQLKEQDGYLVCKTLTLEQEGLIEDGSRL